MKNLFLPYELALIAIEKGFEASCFAEYRQWDGGKPWLEIYQDISDIQFTDDQPYTTECFAPLYQQMLDWFRDEHKLELMVLSNTHVSEEGNKWEYSIYSLHSKDRLKNELNFDTYYKALSKSIEVALKLI